MRTNAMLSVLLASAMATTSPAPVHEGECSIRDVDRCSVYELVWTSEFENALRRFAGNARGDYIEIEDPRLYKQLFSVFGTVDASAKTVKIADGAYFVSGHFSHNAALEGAAVLTRDGRIRAVGLINYKTDTGDLRRDLHVFVHRSEPKQALWIEVIQQWGDEAAKRDYIWDEPNRSGRLRSTHVHFLPGE